MPTVAQIEPLHLGDVVYPEGHPRSGTGPVFAFLIRHAGGPILVDTGLGEPHPLIDRLYRPGRVRLEDALGAHGVRLAEVRAVVNTHLHFDHCGSNVLLPGVPLFVQAAEYEAAHERGYTLTERVDFPGARYEIVNGDAEIAPGVSLLATPGHTVGHQSVVVGAAEGRAIIAGQCTETVDEYVRALQSSDEPVDVPSIESVRRIRDLRPRRVYFSHDTAHWERAR